MREAFKEPVYISPISKIVDASFVKAPDTKLPIRDHQGDISQVARNAHFADHDVLVLASFRRLVHLM